MPRGRHHACGWPGCSIKVEAWQWGCAYHFGRLPADHKAQLLRLKHWWPEAKRARRAATAWAAKDLATDKEKN